MKEVALILLNPIVAIGLLALFAWLLLRSPLLAWMTKLFLLLLWGVGTIGATLFVIFGIYLPKGQYLAAVAAFFAAGLINLFWILIGIPELLKMFRTARGGLNLWES